MSYLEDAFQKAVNDMSIISKGTIKIGNLEVKDFSIDISYAPFTEYGIPPNSFIDELNSFQYHPESTNVIDSDAIVIDENVLALPAPGQKEVIEDDRSGTLSKS